MRVLSLCVALICTSYVFAEEKATDNPSGEKVTANKPVLLETKDSIKEPELHEHPTLLAMLQKNNELRAQVGLPPHRMNAVLTKAAQDHANYMATTFDFQHYSNLGPNGRAAKYGFGAGVLENIAMGQWDVESAFSTWRGSGGHWASIVSGTTDAGFGFQRSANGSPYWVGVYGNGAVVTIPAKTVIASEPKPMMR